LRDIFIVSTFLLFIIGCNTNKRDHALSVDDAKSTPSLIEEYGYTLDNFNVIRDTVRSGDTFGGILDANGISQSKIFEVATTFTDSFDVKKIRIGRPYTLLNSKDSLNKTQVFIYEKNKIDYAVVDFREGVSVSNNHKPVSYLEKEASGVITSSLSQAMADKNLSPYMTDRLANIYAWTINFFAIQAGDNFKVIYTEKYINDTISAGLDEIKAVYFEHRKKPIYAFNFKPKSDTVGFFSDFYDDSANNLRRAFLKAPVAFSRISSRYNLKRKIAYYGNRIRPHKGTDFAAPVGTPIRATSAGVVTKSERKGGNGNYVKIKHNSTYETQYLHMRSRKVKVGDYVKQGEVIGWIGMTGNTSRSHVCYRFWKNGKQVDPFLEELPPSKPLDKQYHSEYFKTITPLKEQLDSMD